MQGTVVFLLFLGLTGLLFFLVLKNKLKYAFFIVIVIAVILRLFSVDTPELNDWDEKYHALVSKHLIKDPLKPTLYKEPILDYRVDDWIGNHIWLSKPFFPLWNIALSIKVFGLNTFAVRLPSILYSILSIFFIFKIGKTLFNVKIGLIASYLYAINGLFIELVGGRVSSDHVEIIFTTLFFGCFYWLIKIKNDNKESILNYFILGGFVGLCFLSKWHVSLLFFTIWLSFVLLQKYRIKNILTYGMSMLIGFLFVVTPILVFLYFNYTVEFKAMFFGLVKPFTTVIQNHSAPWYYYFNKTSVIYGEIVFLTLILFFYKAFKNRNWNSSILILWILIPFILFSIAETKRFTYILIFAPAVFIIIAVFIFEYLPKLKINKIFKVLILVLLIGLPIRYNIERLKYFKNEDKSIETYATWKLNLMNFEASVDGKIILFNDKRYIRTMFYTDIIAYRQNVSKAIVNRLKLDGYSCYYFKDGKYVLID